MAEVIKTGMMFDPLYQEIIQGLDEIVHESAEIGMEDIAVEMRQYSNEIKKIAINSVNKIKE